MAAKVLYSLMSLDLSNLKVLSMPGQKEERKSMALIPGKRGKRENLVAGRRKGKNDLIAPMLFMGSLNAEGFEGWLSLYLLPDLTSPSILIMDNAPIHRKTVIRLLGVAELMYDVAIKIQKHYSKQDGIFSYI